MTPRPHPFPRLALAFWLAGFAPRLAQARPVTLDEGFYRVYQNNLLLGLEHISFQQRNDSSVVTSVVDQLLPRPYATPDTLRKNSALVLAVTDGSLRSYSSTERVNNETLGRGLSMAESTYTSYRESSQGGFGDTYARPPGRIYLVDPQVFALFDVLLRDMQKQTFAERPITMLYLAERDTVVDGHVKRLGKESLKIGSQTVLAEKFSIRDPWSEFIAWMSPKGRMLRLTEAQVRLRVDRAPESLAPGYRDVSSPGKSAASGAKPRATGGVLPKPPTPAPAPKPGH